MRLRLVLTLFLVLTPFLHSKEFSKNNFTPLFANPYEARMAFISQTGMQKLRMDIGASFDMLQIYKNGNRSYYFGSDLMTYTRLRSEGKFKFPVETTDYYFGVNLSSGLISKKDKKSFYEWRLRIAHISSHLIDGYTDENQNFLEPSFVYSREFIDFIFKMNYIDYLFKESDFQPYLGFNYIFSTIPDNFKNFELLTGFNYIQSLSDDLPFELLLAYNFTLKGFDGNYYGVNTLRAGTLFRSNQNRGIFLGFFGYNGPSMHGMFYNQKDSYIGLGIQLFIL